MGFTSDVAWRVDLDRHVGFSLGSYMVRHFFFVPPHNPILSLSPSPVSMFGRFTLFRISLCGPYLDYGLSISPCDVTLTDIPFCTVATRRLLLSSIFGFFLILTNVSNLGITVLRFTFVLPPPCAVYSWFLGISPTVPFLSPIRFWSMGGAILWWG